MGRFSVFVGVLIVAMCPADMMRDEERHADVVDADVKQEDEDSSADDVTQATDVVRADAGRDDEHAAEEQSRGPNLRATNPYNLHDVYGGGLPNPYQTQKKKTKAKKTHRYDDTADVPYQPMQQESRFGNQYLSYAHNTVPQQPQFGGMQGNPQQSFSYMHPGCGQNVAQQIQMAKQKLDLEVDQCCRSSGMGMGTYDVTVSHSGLGICQDGVCHANLPYVEVTYTCPQVCSANPQYLQDWERFFASNGHAALRLSDPNQCRVHGCQGTCYSPALHLRGNVAPNAPLLKDCVAVRGKTYSVEGFVMTGDCFHPFLR